MAIPFSALITQDGTISVTHHDGRIVTIRSTDDQYNRIVELVRDAGPNPTIEYRDEIFDLAQPIRIIEKSTSGRVVVEAGVVKYDGQPVHGVVAERILWMVGQGHDAKPTIAFLERLKKNPSFRAVTELYRFMEHNRMALTPDGYILAYKRVSGTYHDLWTGTIDNSVGQYVRVERAEVNDNPNQLCAEGLHVCSIAYLPSYGARAGNNVVMCKIDPQHVVSIPIEHGNGKMRVCEYEVIAEITDEDVKKDILGQHAVYAPEGYQPVDDYDDDYNDSDHDDYDSDDDDNDGFEKITDDFDNIAHVESIIPTVNEAALISKVIDGLKDSTGFTGRLAYNDPISKTGADTLDAIGYAMTHIEPDFGITLRDSELDFFRGETTIEQIVNFLITKGVTDVRSD